ncbi:hypothetical protein FNF27_01409 [Cafeteria roenbergensis]|uniref:NadR/Ttd14 AAA domain-containing protein n=1 Tax=Cafeteria roenbergensis TaxID=33653 RepID=A0A5A8EHL4_CAFRO|nr:hypothetical protein FNF27_01409 [Cafeteria roenbergensis]
MASAGCVSAPASEAGSLGAAPAAFRHRTNEFRTSVPGSASPANRVYRVVLTGGPCAGKTTALARLTQRFEDFGFSVFRVPEAATLLQSGGLSFAGLRQEQVIDMQAHLMRVQAALEDEFDGIARAATRFASRPSLLLCDRGLLDGRAYVTTAMFREVILAARVDPSVEAAVEAALDFLETEEVQGSGTAPSASEKSHLPPTVGPKVSTVARSASSDYVAGLSVETGAEGGPKFEHPPATSSLLPSLTPHAGPVASQRLRLRTRLLSHPTVATALSEAQARMRDERYDAVIHLVTAADGAPEHYTTANNTTRTETVDQAIAVDCAIRDAWLGSPAHRIVGNGHGGFEAKMDRAVAALSHKLGMPMPGASKRFWVLRCSGIDDWVPADGMAFRDFAVVHTYLLSSHAGRWVEDEDDEDEAAAAAAAGGGAEAGASGGPGEGRKAPLHDSVRLTLRRALAMAEDERAGAESPSVAVDEAGIPLGSDGVPLTSVPSGLNTGEITLQIRAARRLADNSRPLLESQRMLTAREYASLLASRDPERRVVAKRRRVLVHGARAFELDEVMAPSQYRGLCLLSTEVEQAHSVEGTVPPAAVDLPAGVVLAGSGEPGIEATEVTGDLRYLTSRLASGDGPPRAEWADRA